MIALDYLLYDNRTPAPLVGRDFDIKAKTGAIANRRDIQKAFLAYCRLVLGESHHIAGFGAAIGGMRIGYSGGYLLCVTLETPDLEGRPAYAVVGLWCPDRQV